MYHNNLLSIATGDPVDVFLTLHLHSHHITHQPPCTRVSACVCVCVYVHVCVCVCVCTLWVCAYVMCGTQDTDTPCCLHLISTSDNTTAFQCAEIHV